MLLLVKPGYKANAKNTNNGASFRYLDFFNFEEEDQRMRQSKGTSIANAHG
jgi:hypothetical protein